jgi:colanic acid biosynthesis glycosyl transferase WcaI
MSLLLSEMRRRCEADVNTTGRSESRRTFVFLTQVYPPDPGAVGQHLADAAEELTRRGHRVKVFTANRGFDDPSVKYRSREILNGVDVRRLPFGSFGKRSIAARLLSGAVLMVQEILRAAMLRDLDVVVVSTSPPLGPIGAAAVAGLRRVPLKYWPMDVNPDQMVALGRLDRQSLLVKAFDRMNRIVLRRSSDVVALDRMMAAVLLKKSDVSPRMTIVRPWAADEPEESVRHETNPFRQEHGFGDRIVVMYSGNHALSHPLTTILEAARRLQDDPRLLLVFVGGGVGKAEVDAEAGSNIRSLPYQDRTMLRNSLSAADVHLVSIGDSMAGIVHPSKIYGAMAVGRPILLLGSDSNPIADLLRETDIGWRVAHGDVDGAERVLREISAASREELAAMGERARRLIDSLGSREESIRRVCDVLEEGLGFCRPPLPKTAPAGEAPRV